MDASIRWHIIAFGTLGTLSSMRHTKVCQCCVLVVPPLNRSCLPPCPIQVRGSRRREEEGQGIPKARAAAEACLSSHLASEAAFHVLPLLACTRQPA